MPGVTGEAVAAFLGQAGNAELVALAEDHAAIVTAMVRAYTRGGGFVDDEPNEEVAAVITTATARLVTNPGQLAVDHTAGPISESLRGGFQGWTLAELFVLNRYRKRAQ
ncbi:hypothetical protein [Gordonia paraffinivorans]|uniref:hypothetical protein n=1 Tax=Gordonia paraffinivorans TaxID=175628 RepID=UPI0014480044|nr:hypothetical protein [Gordonia paraffinivorans]